MQLKKYLLEYFNSNSDNKSSNFKQKISIYQNKELYKVKIMFLFKIHEINNLKKKWKEIKSNYPKKTMTVKTVIKKNAYKKDT